MSTYALTSIARRGTLLGFAAALLVAAIIPAAAAFADTLNPLTERSLLLSSSAPGFQDTDGSGNATGAPTVGIPGGSYAPAGSGANGKKSGETFSFKVSTDTSAAGTNTPVKAFTLQYCTGAAGLCQAPGDNAGDARDGASTARMDNEDAHVLAEPKSDFEAHFGSLVGGTDYKISVNGTEISSYTDWTVAAINVEDDEHSGNLTGKRNFISLSSPTGITGLETNDKIEIKFIANETSYITNPGSGSFFVKINTYKTNGDTTWVNTIAPLTNINIIDGGVTVANVMTDSIHITTKVLETMSFSVGTQHIDTVVLSSGTHGTCDNIQQVNGNRLQLGDPDGEFSLRTDRAYEVASYWRLSSNSSGGATVYYSGNTLANTVGDEIQEIGATADVSNPGTEQFGLAFDDAGSDTFDPAFNALVAAGNTRHKTPTLLLAAANGTSIPSDIFLAPETNYADGVGSIDPQETIDDPDVEQAKFAFEKSSNTEPAVIAQNNQMVISCATAKMRYIANIGADTPAGVYTTKINYLAAPQY